MALVQATLKSGLEAMSATDSEATSIQRFVDAWDDYWAGASVAGVPANAGTYSAGLSAMQGAMSGMSTSGAGAAKIQAGITAFWGAIAQSPTTIWTTAPITLVPPITPPPGLSGIAAALTSTFATNTSGSLSLSDSAAAVAAVLHSAGGFGAVVSGSVIPAPPAPIPIM